MAPPVQPAFVDERLLATLERAFEKHAVGGDTIDAPKLQAALGLRSEYLAQRVLLAFDTNGDGVIRRDEFLDGVRRVVFGDDREKLLFAFRIHDHNGDGFLDQNELYRMIAVSLAESDVAARASQPPERLANALFLAADRNRDGRISFEEFEAVVRSRPLLLHKMTLSEAQWIAPNEDLIAWIDGSRSEKPSRLAAFLEDGWTRAGFILLWLAGNVAVFVVSMLGASAHTDLLMQTGRALGACLDLNGALILVPVMRRLLTWVRSSALHRVVPVDDAIAFHKLVGHAMFALALTHSAVFVAVYTYGHASSSLARLLFETPRGLTGFLLLAVFVVMWVCALPFLRRTSRFELFYFSHLLYVVWLGLLIAHAPSFLMFGGATLLGFVIEQLVRLRRRGAATIVEAAQALRSGVTKLQIRRPPGFKHAAGDYVFLRIPAIAGREWHPFTISSAPESAVLTVHVRTLGNWTAALRRRVEEQHARGDRTPLDIYVDGPYGSPSAHIFNSTNAVFIGAGIGVTPFAAVLESIVLRAQHGPPIALQKAHFFWLNKDQYSFEWFADLLREIEKADYKNMLEIHLCMTAGRVGATALALEAARDVMHAAGRTDIVTGLKTHTHMGAPDWDGMLGYIAQIHAPDPVDVYFCGPPGLAAKLRPICEKRGMRMREEQF